MKKLALALAAFIVCLLPAGAADAHPDHVHQQSQLRNIDWD